MNLYSAGSISQNAHRHWKCIETVSLWCNGLSSMSYEQTMQLEKPGGNHCSLMVNDV